MHRLSFVIFMFFVVEKTLDRIDWNFLDNLVKFFHNPADE